MNPATPIPRTAIDEYFFDCAKAFFPDPLEIAWSCAAFLRSKGWRDVRRPGPGGHGSLRRSAEAETFPMKSILRLALVLFAIAQAPIGALSAASVSDTASADVTRILVEEEVAWNSGDAEAHGAHFANDCTFTNVLGMVFHGREAFIARHAELFRTIFSKSKMKQTIRRLHFPAENIAVVDVDIELTEFRAVPPGVQPPADGKLRTKLLQVLLMRNGKWEIVAYHNVDLKPTPVRAASQQTTP